VFALLVLAALLPVPAARASPPAELDLEEYAAGSTLIVQGTLDANGELTVERTLYGEAPGEKPLRVDGGAEIHEGLARAMKQEKALPVVAFLELEPAKWTWLPVNDGGVFGLTGKDVYQNVRRYGRDGLLVRVNLAWSSWTPERFLKTVRAEIPRVAERDRVAAQPRSLDRARRLLTLDPDGVNSFARTVKALTPADPDEELVVGVRLGEADDEERPLLLRLIREVGYVGLWDKVAFFVERGHPSRVRVEAFSTLVKLDSARGSDRLARLLRADDPDLESLLGAVLDAAGDGKRSLSREVAAALPFLACEVRRLARERHLRQAGQELPPLVEVLAAYAHPGCLPLLFDWAMAENDPGSHFACDALLDLSGLGRIGAGRRDLAAWWERARLLLEPRYDLETDAGRKAWREAYAVADPGTRRVLLQLWFFEPAIDEGRLVKEAEGDHFSQSAQAVLDEMAKRGKRPILVW
jgi:hypothetical protein